MSRMYPRKVWFLQPSFKPVEIEVIAPARAWGDTDYGDETASGKWLSLKDMHESKPAAIAAGRAAVEKMEADLVKRRASIDKKVAALNKAEAK